jgi:2-methylcitrate dehydratase PrpD
MTLPVTERLAEFVESAGYESVSEKALWNAKLHILDTFGVALAGVASPVGKIALEHCRRGGGAPDVQVWGSALKTSPATAAFTNGLLAHAIDYDDWDNEAGVGHPSCMVVASALSVAETAGAKGKEFLKAYALGIEIAARIASGCPETRPRGYHSTPIYGIMGATAAAASILRLRKDALKAAFGVAASAASGLHRQQGSMVKPFHAGNAARNAVDAALLAAQGFTADAAIFENPNGFCDTIWGPGACDLEKIVNHLGNPFYLESPGLGLKLYPCSAPQFLAADAALHLMQEHRLHYRDVRKVSVRIPPLRYRRHYHPNVTSGLQGKFAINYVVALCVLDGRLQISTFTDDKVNEPQVKEALGKVDVVSDETIPEPGKYCPVSVELNDGTVLSHTARVAKGHPQNPLSLDEVLNKFRGNVREVLSPPRCEELIARTLKLEELEDVRALVPLLTPERF